MIRELLHPSPRVLQTFALSPEETTRPRVQRHLARCSRCRAEIVAIREIASRAAAVESRLPLRADALERVLGARQSGMRAVLPAEPRSGPRSRTRSWLRVAAAVLALAAGGLLLRGWGEGVTATGTSGTLKFSPGEPRPGDVIQVEYDAAPMLADEEALVLRARFRTRWHESGESSTRQTVAARLTRAKGWMARGRFTGSFRLPDDAVYGAFAVENPDASTVDANLGRQWELLVYDGGRPTYFALLQRLLDLIARDPRAAVAAGVDVTTLHPDEPGGWAQHRSFASYMLGQGYLDSSRGTLAARAAYLDTLLRKSATVRLDQMNALRGFIGQVGFSPGPDGDNPYRYWTRRFYGDTSTIGKGSSLIGKLDHEVHADRGRARAALDSIERIWMRGDSLEPLSTVFGRQIAQAAGDTAALRRWLERQVTHNPGHELGVYRMIAVRPEYAHIALASLRAYIARLDRGDEPQRPLDATATDDAARRRALSRVALTALGKVLLRSGDTVAARDTLILAAAHGWDIAVLREVAALSWQAGDTMGAARVSSLVAADPWVVVAAKDSISRRFAGLLGAPAWERLQREADGEMIRRVMESAISRGLPTKIRIVDERGEQTTIRDLADGRVTVVGFWSYCCDLDGYEQLRSALVERGARFVAIATESRRPYLLRRLRESHYDELGEARPAFANVSEPQYYVLDRHGRVRFQGHNSPQLALAQAVALLQAGSREERR